MTRPIAIVTGASSGFGLAVTADLVSAGWHVVVDGRSAGRLAAAVEPFGDAVRAVAGDVTDAEHRRRLVAGAEALGGVDLLVNNAGGLGPAPLPSLSSVDVAELGPLFDVNVVAPLALTQLALPSLRARRGAVVDVTSDASVEPYEGWGAYGCTKAALDHLSRVLAVEEPGVRMWALDPGDMRTPMHQAAFPGEDISDRPLPAESAPAVRRLVEVRPPSGRVRAADVLVVAAVAR